MALYLKSRFTANPKNIYAINFGEHKLTARWLCYLNKCNYPVEKQSQHIFSFGWQHSLDDENWYLNKNINLYECSEATPDEPSITGQEDEVLPVIGTRPEGDKPSKKIQNDAAKKAQIKDYENQILFYQNEIKILKK